MIKVSLLVLVLSCQPAYEPTQTRNDLHDEAAAVAKAVRLPKRPKDMQWRDYR